MSATAAPIKHRHRRRRQDRPRPASAGAGQERRLSASSPPPAATPASTASPASRPSRRCSTRCRSSTPCRSACRRSSATDAARTALEAGKHVFLEKPPGATVSEVEDLKALAAAKGVSLFASWHSRYAPAVEAARAFLASTRIDGGRDQLEGRRAPLASRTRTGSGRPAGFGVFDPGINALSIATHILPKPLFVTAATLDFPENRDAPIAAQIAFSDADGLPVTADFDWRQTGPQSWDIVAETDAGQMVLSAAAPSSSVDGRIVHEEPEAEYPMLYRRFAEIVRAGVSDVDLAPLRHVADAFMLGRRISWSRSSTETRTSPELLLRRRPACSTQRRSRWQSRHSPWRRRSGWPCRRAASCRR